MVCSECPSAFRKRVMEHSYFSLKSIKNIFHSIFCLFLHMVPLILVAESVPDFQLMSSCVCACVGRGECFIHCQSKLL